ncbi:MAG: AAA family ATPase [Gemmatimonadota bacterium]
MIVCRTLGPVEAILDGEPAPRELLWRKNLALLLYLARSPGRRRSRSHLLGLLWADKPESAARHSLNEALRVLRRLASDELLCTQGELVALAEDGVELDTQLFEARLAAEEWDDAASLIRGEFLEGFEVPDSSAFEDWLGAERAYWRRRSVDALAVAAEARLSRGDVAGGIEAAERARGLDAFSNAAARAVMRAAALEGERARALDLYEDFTERLDREFQVEPEPETIRLADRIRRERTWRLPEVIREEAAAGRRLPLIGRQEELREALEAWRRCAAEKRAGVLILEGEPGVGKTRLAEEILARIRLEGGTLASIRAVPSDLASPWSGLLALCRGDLVEAPGLVAAAPGALAAVAAEVPEWGEQFAEEIEGATPASLARAFSEILRASAAEQPVVLFVDDAEWLDKESAMALRAVVRDLEKLPLFLALANAAHPPREELDELRAHLGREIDGAVLTLRPLEREKLAELAAHLLPEYDAAELERVVRRVEADSAGLPLLATELLHAIRLGLELEEGPAVWPESQRTLDQTLPGELPDAVTSATRIGFRRLSGEAQEVLASAAVLGERVEPAVLERATGLSNEAVTHALDELEWKRWLVVEPRGYSFVARIVAEVLREDMLTPGQRRRILEATDPPTGRAGDSAAVDPRGDRPAPRRAGDSAAARDPKREERRGPQAGEEQRADRRGSDSDPLLRGHPGDRLRPAQQGLHLLRRGRVRDGPPSLHPVRDADRRQLPAWLHRDQRRGL